MGGGVLNKKSDRDGCRTNRCPVSLPPAPGFPLYRVMALCRDQLGCGRPTSLEPTHAPSSPAEKQLRHPSVTPSPEDT